MALPNETQIILKILDLFKKGLDMSAMKPKELEKAIALSQGYTDEYAERVEAGRKIIDSAPAIKAEADAHLEASWDSRKDAENVLAAANKVKQEAEIAADEKQLELNTAMEAAKKAKTDYEKKAILASESKRAAETFKAQLETKLTEVEELKAKWQRKVAAIETAKSTE